MKNVAATRGQKASLPKLFAVRGRAGAVDWAGTATVLNFLSLGLLKEISQQNYGLFALYRVLRVAQREKRLGARVSHPIFFSVLKSTPERTRESG